MKQSLFKLFVSLGLSIFLASGLTAIFPQSAHAQDGLRRMTVEQQTTDRILVFASHPDRAAVVITSSIPGLQIDTNLGIVADQSESGTGEYRIILEPSRQIIYIDAPGFIRAVFQTGNLNPRDVIHLNVEPEDRSITDTGMLLIRTQPAGATIRIAGIPGTFTSPFTFDPILAQTHSVQIELQDYKTETLQIRVEPNQPKIETIVLTPTFGFLVVNAVDAQLFLQPEDLPTPSRRAFTSGQAFRLDTGNYIYRLERPFYKNVTGAISIEPGQTVQLSPTFSPDFAELHVRANIGGFRLSAPDNNAPSPSSPTMLYLEPGLRDVQVSAPGYEPATLQLRVVSGARIDTTLTLVSLEEMRRRRELEAVPRGILQVSSDLSETQIFINGEYQGDGTASVSLVPGRHTVEYRHPIGRQREVIDISSAEFISRQVIMRPSRSRAVFLSAVIPGGGHLYTKRSRGYLYLGLTAAAAGFAYYSYTEFQDVTERYDAAVQVYHQASSFEQAIQLRGEADALFKDKEQSYNHLMASIAIAGGLHLLQYLDVMISRPRYGYRDRLSATLLPTAYSNIPAVALRIEL
jgi:hypothetical protein